MTVIVLALAVYSAALSAHFVIWRIGPPRSTIRMLAGIFSFGFLVMVAVFIALLSPFSVLDLLYCGLLYGLLALCYLITYMAVDGDSPTLSIVSYLRAGGAEGVSLDELRAFMRDRPFMRSRLDRLIDDGFVRRDGDHLRPSPRSFLLLRIFDAYRRIARRATAGG